MDTLIRDTLFYPGAYEGALYNDAYKSQYVCGATATPAGKWGKTRYIIDE